MIGFSVRILTITGLTNVLTLQNRVEQNNLVFKLLLVHSLKRIKPKRDERQSPIVFGGQCASVKRYLSDENRSAI